MPKTVEFEKIVRIEVVWHYFELHACLEYMNCASYNANNG